MNQETGPQVKSPLDVLVDKASKESAEQLAKGPKIIALGGTAQNLQPRAKEQLEHLVAKARADSRHFVAKLAEGKTYVEERAARHANDSTTEQVKERVIQIEEDIFREVNKILTDVMTSVFVNLGVSETTTKEIVSEIAKQESKIIAFPKK